MKKRNLIVTGASLGVACAAIAAGAIVSGNAMAASDGDPITATMTIVQVEGGEAIECTFDDIQLPVLSVGTGQGLPGAPAGDAGSVVISGSAPDGGPLPAPGEGGLNVTVGGTTGDGPSFQVGGAPPAGAEASSGVISIGVGDPATLGSLPLPDGIDAKLANPRPGTAEECAAMRAGTQIGLAVPPPAAQAVPPTTGG